MEDLSLAELKDELSQRGPSKAGNKSILLQCLKGRNEAEQVEVEDENPEDSIGPHGKTSQVSQGSSVFRNSKGSEESEHSIRDSEERMRILSRSDYLAQKITLQKERVKLQEEKVKLEEEKLKFHMEAMKLRELCVREKALPTSGSVASQQRAVGPCELKEQAKVETPSQGKVDSSNASSSKVSDNPIPQSGSKDIQIREHCNPRELMTNSEIPVFSGDATEYITFINAFERVMSDSCTDEGERLGFLTQFTTGTPRDIVTACAALPAEQGYKLARKELHEKYGEEVVVNTYVNEIENWPEIPSGDVAGLERFAIKISLCSDMLSSRLKGSMEMERSETIARVVSSLPSPVQEKWNAKAKDINTLESRNANIADLAEFVIMESKIMSDPVFGKETMDKLDKPKESKTSMTDNQKSRQANKPKGKVNNTTVEQEKRHQLKCSLCNKKHYLAECETLRNIPERERTDYIRQRSLCFGCLCRGHTTNACRKRRYCKICRGRHPTALHWDTSFREYYP